ncbi:MAG: STAS/SEC14 domain-containing protein [Bacteroidales bacterium]|jgi:hypothetical protein|nr:STAS/SEC14 domain-containing protein [Bacteroidales bacterium]MDD4216796.1 STAS/SEC14 domain-containing protein [Bacteroidales bacterium]MDY0142059.1 STAS/SEC14 domain-containing protein [Bacteroidales bacterium]
MKYKISVDYDLHIVRYKHDGLITADDIGQAWQELLLIPEFSHNKYNLLSDYRNSKFDMSIEEMGGIIQYLRNLDNVLRGKKQSLLVENPNSTALSLLFENTVNAQMGFLVKVFTSEQAAINWLLI